MASASFTGQGAVLIDRPGETVLRFFAVSAAGARGSTHTERYTIDPDPPGVTASPTGGVFPGAVTVVLEAQDAIDPNPRIYYTTDGSEPDPAVPSPHFTHTGALVLDAPGSVTVRFVAVDEAGNRGTLESQTYRIASGAPATAASVPGGAYRTAQSVTLTAADAVDPNPTVYYTTDGSEPTTASPSFAGSGTVAIDAMERTTTLKFFAMNGAGLREPTRTETYTLTRTPPSTRLTPAGGVYALGSAADTTPGRLEARLEASHPLGIGTTIAYTTDGTDPATSATAKTASGSAAIELAGPGRVVLRYRAVDAAGNEEPVRAETYVLVQPKAVAQGPNPVAVGGVARFTFHLDQPGVLYVVSAAGRVVHRVEVPAGASVHEWDLTALDGRPVAQGLYLYRVVLEDGTALATATMAVRP